MSAAIYKVVMQSINGEVPVDRALFDQAVAYAKSSKRRVPKTGLFVAPTKSPTIKSIVKAERAAEKAALAAEKAEKAAARATVKAALKALKDAKAPKPTICEIDVCDKPYYAKGLCSQHYTQKRREDPAQHEAANEASRQYRARNAITVVVKASK